MKINIRTTFRIACHYNKTSRPVPGRDVFLILMREVVLMSHFVTFVLVPKDSLDVDEAVSTLLAPYDEAIPVAPYKTDCYCIDEIARQAGVEAADRAHGNMNDLRTRYWNLPKEKRPTWKAWTAGWTVIADRVEQAHPLYQKPDPDCEECQGSGQRLTTYNPDSQWDWWVIGGRWNGWLSRTNQLKARTAAQKGKFPFAVVTPDGVWHDKGKMSWWGMASDKKV
jgi:hypothetical protein